MLDEAVFTHEHSRDASFAHAPHMSMPKRYRHVANLRLA